MCRLYGATEDMTKALMALARETKAKGWWQRYEDVVPEWFDLFVGLEGAANRKADYEHSVVPGHRSSFAPIVRQRIGVPIVRQRIGVPIVRQRIGVLTCPPTAQRHTAAAKTGRAAAGRLSASGRW
jgi:hypothetical protein